MMDCRCPLQYGNALEMLALPVVGVR
jgi:hypothetical protein